MSGGQLFPLGTKANISLVFSSRMMDKGLDGRQEAITAKEYELYVM